MYLRALIYLPELTGGYISSGKLAEFMNINSPQIRKDFSYFGAFGTRGIGYNVSGLITQIRGILKLDVTQQAALVGAGRLGAAIAEYPGFSMFGFDITVIFDNDQSNTFARKIPSYYTVDTKISHRYRGFRLTAEVNNIFDEKFYDYGVSSTFTPGVYNAYPLPERTILFTVSKDFGNWK